MAPRSSKSRSANGSKLSSKHSPTHRKGAGKKSRKARETPEPNGSDTQSARVVEAKGKGDIETPGLRTLSVDIGGTGIKMIVLDEKGQPITDRIRWLTPQPANPKNILEVIKQMLSAVGRFDRVSVGFPGVVVGGVVQTAANLDSKAWKGFDLEKALVRITQVPSRVMNDADLQGFGVIEGRGVELVLTLGTGLGSALFVDGILVPNLELGHHPFMKGKTYEQRVCDAAYHRLGKKEWSQRVGEMIDQLAPILNYDVMHLGGGNAQNLRLKLPRNVKLFDNVDGMTGGIRLWELGERHKLASATNH
ncbi:MAG TPA: ROK family protein [Polyangiaceae bacterium]|nr:ROK family protein [Polyangiaceae bacterium]